MSRLGMDVHFFGSGSVQSGEVYCRPMFLSIASGLVISGYGTIRSGYGVPSVSCLICNCDLTSLGSQSVTIFGASGQHKFFCWNCAGYKPEQQRFQTMEDTVRAMAPLPVDTPAEIVADWFEDRQVYQAANFMRGLCSGG